MQSPAVAVAAAYKNLHKTASKQKLSTNFHKVFTKLPQKLHKTFILTVANQTQFFIPKCTDRSLLCVCVCTCFFFSCKLTNLGSHWTYKGEGGGLQQLHKRKLSSFLPAAAQRLEVWFCSGKLGRKEGKKYYGTCSSSSNRSRS
jgi:hypothetical protein